MNAHEHAADIESRLKHRLPIEQPSVHIHRGHRVALKITGHRVTVGAAPVQVHPALPTDGGTYTDMSTRDVTGTIQPSDVHQGSLSDCYFLAALLKLSDSEDGKAEIRGLLKPGGMANEWVGTFQINGITTEVFCNMMIGSVQESPGSTGSIWAAMLEKMWAYARYGFDTFTSINFGFNNFVFFCLGNDPSIPQPNSVSDCRAMNKKNMCVSLESGNSHVANLPSSHAASMAPESLQPADTSIGIFRNPWGIEYPLISIIDSDIAGSGLILCVASAPPAVAVAPVTPPVIIPPSPPTGPITMPATGISPSTPNAHVQPYGAEISWNSGETLMVTLWKRVGSLASSQVMPPNRSAFFKPGEASYVDSLPIDSTVYFLKDANGMIGSSSAPVLPPTIPSTLTTQPTTPAKTTLDQAVSDLLSTNPVKAVAAAYFAGK